MSIMRRAHLAIGPVLAVLLLLATVEGASTPADKCAAAKLVAAGKKTGSKLACYGKAAKKGVTVDDACLGKAEQKFTAAFAKAEAKGSCRTTGDAAAIEADVDAMLATLVTDEPDHCGAVGDSCASVPCCPGLVCPASDPVVCQTSTTTTTTTTLPPCGGSICNGTCPPNLHCGHIVGPTCVCL